MFCQRGRYGQVEINHIKPGSYFARARAPALAPAPVYWWMMIMENFKSHWFANWFCQHKKCESIVLMPVYKYTVMPIHCVIGIIIHWHNSLAFLLLIYGTYILRAALQLEAACEVRANRNCFSSQFDRALRCGFTLPSCCLFALLVWIQGCTVIRKWPP